jgi:hypothetical protein
VRTAERSPERGGQARESPRAAPARPGRPDRRSHKATGVPSTSAPTKTRPGVARHVETSPRESPSACSKRASSEGASPRVVARAGDAGSLATCAHAKRSDTDARRRASRRPRTGQSPPRSSPSRSASSGGIGGARPSRKYFHRGPFHAATAAHRIGDHVADVEPLPAGSRPRVSDHRLAFAGDDGLRSVRFEKWSMDGTGSGTASSRNSRTNAGTRRPWRSTPRIGARCRSRPVPKACRMV